MAICTNCGGNGIDIGGGRFRCQYCMNEFTEGYVASSSQRGSSPAGGVNVFDKNINGVLEIACEVSGGISQGSGLLIKKSGGFAVTNAHVVSERGTPSQRISVKVAGETVRAKIVAIGRAGGSWSNDLAVLKLERVPQKAVEIKLADFRSVRNGEQVFVIGNSRGEGTCITSGIVSDRLRSVDGHKLMMTDCAVNPGNSGGPIFNASGDAIGVIVSKTLDTEGMNYAIPADTVIAFIQNAIR